MAEQALALAEELVDEEAIPAALALLSQALQMRGAEGDLGRAIDLGDRALREWVPGARPVDRSEALYLYRRHTVPGPATTSAPSSLRAKDARWPPTFAARSSSCVVGRGKRLRSRASAGYEEALRIFV